MFSPEKGEKITLIAFEAFNDKSFKFPVPLDRPVNPFIELRGGSNGSIQIQAKKASAIDATNVESITKAKHQQKKFDVRRSNTLLQTMIPCVPKEE